MLAVLSLVVCGCGRDAVAPRLELAGRDELLVAQSFLDSRSAERVPTFTARWNAVALEIIPRLRVGPVPITRSLAYLTLAQSRAVQEALQEEDPHESRVRGAVSGASVVVLSYLFPVEAPRLEALLAAQSAEADQDADNFATGVARGRLVGDETVAQARTDNFDAVWTGTVPTGEGIWFSSLVPAQAPATPMLGHMRTFHMTAPDQFRPGPPPAFGSPPFLEALAEVRRISNGRTAEQDMIAKRWALSTGTISPTGYFNQVAIGLAEGRGFGERRTADVLATMNTAMMDAYIACWDAKYVYWLLRPIQADPAITLAIPMANHPSYPSGHSCISAAAAEVLSATFHKDREMLRATLDEIGISRVYAGVHYRFDIEAANAIGESVARLAIREYRRRYWGLSNYSSPL